jgi:hypothetical protein
MNEFGPAIMAMDQESSSQQDRRIRQGAPQHGSARGAFNFGQIYQSKFVRFQKEVT